MAAAQNHCASGFLLFGLDRQTVPHDVDRIVRLFDAVALALDNVANIGRQLFVQCLLVLAQRLVFTGLHHHQNGMVAAAQG